MSFHATAAVISARSDRLSKFRNYLLSSVCAALIVAAAGPGAHAQVPGKYFNADGSRTDDLEKAAATWRADKEFQGNWGVGALKVEYAYARGLIGRNLTTGERIKIGIVDSGFYNTHYEFSPTSRFHAIFAIDPNAPADPNKPNGISGNWINGVNDSHGTKVTGVISAARDGTGMHGVAFDADIYVGNTNATDALLFGAAPQAEFPKSTAGYLAAVYDAVAAQGVRIISNSWGSQPSSHDYSTLPKLFEAYQEYDGKNTWIERAARVSTSKNGKEGVINNFSAGNSGYDNASLRGSLPYFRPELEGHWMTTTGFANNQKDQIYNRCGIAKYWCIMAPTMVQTTDTNGGLSNGFNGTSAAAPHASAALALIMQRFPYMTNEQALSVLFTTAQNMVASPDVSPTTGTRSRTPVVPGTAQVPNAVTGWGLVDLQKAMNGPGQFLGRFDANLGAGARDIWSNDISQVALDQRKREEAEEVAAWATRKKVQGWENGIGEKQRSELAKIIEPQFSSDKIAAAEALLADLVKAVAAGKPVPAPVKIGDPDIEAYRRALMAANAANTAIDTANDKIKADPLASALLADFKKAYPKAVVTYGKDPSADFAAYKAGRKQDPLAVLKQTMLAEQIAPLETEYQFTEPRTAYLSGKLADPKSYDAGLTKSGLGSLWLTGKNTYRGDTVINGGELGIGLGGSVVSTSIINDTGLLTVDGTAAAITANTGGQLKVNTTGVTGDLTLNGGFASVDGRSGAAVINTGGVLGGIGLVRSFVARNGGTVSPGNSVGTLHVAGDATFDRGSFFDVEIATDKSRADRLDIGGNVTLLGGVVSVRLAGEKASVSQEQIKDLFAKSYTILIADGTVSGTFENVRPQYTYITPSLLYATDKSAVSLGFDLTETAKTEAAEKLAVEQAAALAEAERLKTQLLEEQVKHLILVDAVTPNQKSTGRAVMQLGLGNRLLQTVLFSQKGEVLAYDSLSGEAHASLRGTLLQDAGLVSGAASERVRAAFDGVAAKAAPVATPLAYGPEAKDKRNAGEAFDAATPAPVAATTAVWGQAYGGWSHGASDGNAAAYNRSTGGIVTGIDALIAGTWRLGVLAGYGSTSLHGAGSSVSADSYQVGIYGGTRIDALTLSLGTVLAHHEIDTRRTVSFGTLEETDTAGYSANTVQLFGEAAYRIETPYAALEPFAAAAYTHLKTAGFTETGGIAVLSAPSSSTDLTTTTLGLRASRAFTLGNATTLTARGMAGWRHAYGDVTPQAQLAFASGGESFDVSGLPIAADAALVEAGLAFDIGRATTLGLTYTGQFSSGVNDNAVKADLTVRF